ncbi:hypothetical protein GCM10009713_06100 [Brevibacterium celere]
MMLPCLGEHPDLPIGMCPQVAARIRENVARIETESADLARRRRAIEKLIALR